MKTLLILLLPFSPLANESIPGLEVKSQKEWPGESLYGFMNGGSELFLEYGFTTMLEQSVTLDGATYQIEYYQMDSEASAYGIYSIHCFKCQRADSLTQAECYIPSYLQFQHGSLYVTLVAPSRSEAARVAMDKMASAILAANPISNPPDKTAPGSDGAPEVRTSGRDYFVRGDLGLSSANISWCPYFEGYHYTLWMRSKDSEVGQDKLFTGTVQFTSVEECDAFIAQEAFTNADSKISVQRVAEKSVVIEDIE